MEIIISSISLVMRYVINCMNEGLRSMAMGDIFSARFDKRGWAGNYANTFFFYR